MGGAYITVCVAPCFALQVVDKIFEQMFEKDGNVTDPEVLVKAAKNAGLPEVSDTD